MAATPILLTLVVFYFLRRTIATHVRAGSFVTGRVLEMISDLSSRSTRGPSRQSTGSHSAFHGRPERSRKRLPYCLEYHRVAWDRSLLHRRQRLG